MADNQPKFELDNTMLKFLEQLNRQVLMLNSMNGKYLASYQLNHNRIIIIVQHHHGGLESWAEYSFQSHFINLTYQTLKTAIEEINYYLKYTHS